MNRPDRLPPWHPDRGEPRIVRIRKEIALARRQLEAAREAGDPAIVAVWEKTVAGLEHREAEAVRG